MNLHDRAARVIRRNFRGITITMWPTDVLDDHQQNQLRSRPRPYLRTAVELLRWMSSTNIVEIGCMRQPMNHLIDESGPACCNDGHSTMFWASTGKPVWSVDIDREACVLAAGYVHKYPNVKIIMGDGIAFLERFPEPIGLLYLDGWDVAPGTDYAEKHLLAYQAAKAKLAATSMILIDDTDLLFGGKGKLAVPAAIRDGFELLLLGRQAILLRAPR